MEDTLDLEQCANFLNIDTSTAQKLAATGILPGAKIGKGWVFLRSDLVEYLRAEVRRQQRERQGKATVEQELKAAAERNPSMVMEPPRKRGREKRTLPDLSSYSVEKLAMATAT